MSKYIKGEQIKNFNEFLKQEFIYHQQKLLHRGWFLSWNVMFAANQINNGNLYYAIKIKKENE
jgi:hypothetical protein